jgi:hypothetical protein
MAKLGSELYGLVGGGLGSYSPGQEKVVMRLSCCQTYTYGFQA